MKWIRVKDALPEIDIPVLIFTNDHEYSVAILEPFKGRVYNQRNYSEKYVWNFKDTDMGECNPLLCVLCWQPLPLPPEDLEL